MGTLQTKFSISPGKRAQELHRVGSRQVDARVEDLSREGHSVLPLKPYPERPLPPHVLDAAMRAIHDPHSAPSRGLESLRQSIAGRLQSELSVALDPASEILVTNGGMHALFTAFGGLLDPGDEVIVPAPCYFLEGIADLLGFRLMFVPMRQESDFQFDYERLEAAVTPRTRALFLNTPVNPTGYVVTRPDLDFLIQLAHKYGIWLVSDESYDRMVYDGEEHNSPLGLPDGRECSILIRSLTKSYCMPAWRVGYIAAPAHTIPELTKVLEWQSLFGNSVSQAAAAAALSGPHTWLDGIAEEFQLNRDSILNSIQDTRLTYVVPKGAPFVFLNTSQLDMTGDAFAQILLEQFGIAATPGSTLQAPYHVRIPIGGPVELIEEAGSRIQHASQL